VKRFFLISAILLVAFSLLRLTINRTQTDFCANSISCVKNLTVNIENDENGVFNGQKVTPPKIDLATDRPKTEVLGESTATGEKHIYVDLTTQTLYAYQGQTLFMQTLISSGKWRATPPGDYRIWIKLRASRMTGGEGADFYDLPNVPYVMFFANNNVPESSGFSLHGAYWHNNFGHAMSHGCVNMRAIDAEKLYNWADPPTTGPTTLTSANNQGTEITIYGQAL
jgi:lipoprotein-anchoring transpeptidase ErfK/SrfK